MKSNNTKHQIMAVALDRFSEEGYSGTSIREIAGIVGIRESAIYNHFGSKEEIFTSNLSEFRKKQLANNILSDDLLDDLSNPEKFLMSFARKLIGHWNLPDERKFMRILLIEQHTKIGASVLSVSLYLDELRNICKMIFGEMIKSGILKKYDTEILSSEFIGPLFILRVEKMCGPEGDDIEPVINAAAMHVKFFWDSVKAI